MCSCAAAGLFLARKRFAENRYEPSAAALWAEIEYWQARLDAPCRCA